MNVDLTEEERLVLGSLVRRALRDLARSRQKLAQKLGDEYDPTRQDPREAALKSAYRKLGFDPTRLDNDVVTELTDAEASTITLLPARTPNLTGLRTVDLPRA